MANTQGRSSMLFDARMPLMRWLAAAVSLLVLCSATPGLCDPLSRPTNREARDHLDRGNKLYNIGSFDEAVAEYKAGALIESSPVFDYNLGQANRQLGRYREALWHYDRFLHKAQPTGEIRDAVIAFMAEMRAHLGDKTQKVPPGEPAPQADASPPRAVTVPTSQSRSEHFPPTSSQLPVRDNSTDWIGWGLVGCGVVALAAAGTLLYRAAKLNDDGDSEME